MSKKILTIGLELATNAVHHEKFRSKISLLDWDIILFKPLISEFINYTNTYQGKPSLDDTSSFQLKESCEHWRREIKQAVEAGKIVLVFLPSIQEVYIDTGQRQYSGTGKNQKTTRIVAPYTNYEAIPYGLSPINATGNSMKLAPLGAEVLSPYWSEFGAISEYKVLLASETPKVCLMTRTGDKPVGALLRSKVSSGTLALLPDIDFYPDHFLQQKGKDQFWTDKAKQFASQFIGVVVALDKALRSSAEVTPEPGWASGHTYVLPQELTLRAALLDAERRVEEAQKAKELLQEQLNNAGQLRALLYEKGKPLESAIIEALRTLGFDAVPYKEADSEFDVVFSCAEGRLLGEAEGKDTKAVNVDKLRQLAMNIHEDLQREEIDTPAKGVLFGNGYRLTSPIEREAQFTDKCISAAQSSSTALVATSSLFEPIQYLSAHNNEEYKKQCREAILTGIGPVTIPAPPSSNSELVSDALN